VDAKTPASRAIVHAHHHVWDPARHPYPWLATELLTDLPPADQRTLFDDNAVRTCRME
jgi:predicted TIM-barrel fold metal-dependent hydrolase